MPESPYRWVIVALGGLMGCVAIGPVAGGWVFDTFSNYAWLYISSAAVAVGAVLLALLFPKPRPVLA